MSERLLALCLIGASRYQTSECSSDGQRTGNHREIEWFRCCETCLCVIKISEYYHCRNTTIHGTRSAVSNRTFYKCWCKLPICSNTRSLSLFENLGMVLWYDSFECIRWWCRLSFTRYSSIKLSFTCEERFERNHHQDIRKEHLRSARYESIISLFLVSWSCMLRTNSETSSYPNWQISKLTSWQMIRVHVVFLFARCEKRFLFVWLLLIITIHINFCFSW